MKIGNYKGKGVYKIDRIAYVRNRLFLDKECMYVIDGKLIYDNKIIGGYDGRYVTDYDLPYESYISDEITDMTKKFIEGIGVKVEEKEEQGVKVEEKEEVQGATADTDLFKTAFNLDFSKYSKEVDQFMSTVGGDA